MHISIDGVKLITEFEGFKAHPYLDSTGLPTIGYGSTLYPDGKKVTMQDKPVTQEKAMDMMGYHINTNVIPYLVKYLQIILSQHKIDALCSLVYNIGAGNFQKSTVLKLINTNSPIQEIEKSWLQWNKAGGKELAGLVKRRKAEISLYKNN